MGAWNAIASGSDGTVSGIQTVYSGVGSSSNTINDFHFTDSGLVDANDVVRSGVILKFADTGAGVSYAWPMKKLATKQMRLSIPASLEGAEITIANGATYVAYQLPKQKLLNIPVGLHTYVQLVDRPNPSVGPFVYSMDSARMCVFKACLEVPGHLDNRTSDMC